MLKNKLISFIMLSNNNRQNLFHYLDPGKLSASKTGS